MMNVNQRERLYTQRALIAWSDWLKAGRTLPNPGLGYPTTTVEYALLRGLTGGDRAYSSTVPGRFNIDKEIEQVDKVFWRLPVAIKEPITLIYIYRKCERDAAHILGTTRHQIRIRLNKGYKRVFDGLVQPK